MQAYITCTHTHKHTQVYTPLFTPPYSSTSPFLPNLYFLSSAQHASLLPPIFILPHPFPSLPPLFSTALAFLRLLALGRSVLPSSPLLFSFCTDVPLCPQKATKLPDIEPLWKRLMLSFVKTGYKPGSPWDPLKISTVVWGFPCSSSLPLFPVHAPTWTPRTWWPHLTDSLGDHDVLLEGCHDRAAHSPSPRRAGLWQAVFIVFVLDAELE